MSWSNYKPAVSEVLLTIIVFALLMFLWGALFGWVAHLFFRSLT